MSLWAKTLFIAGASRGIGLAIALRAAREGANIVIAAKTAEAHPKLPGTIFSAAEQIEKAGGKVLPLVVDVRDEADIQSAVARTVTHFGGIDACINNASALHLAGTETMPEIVADAAWVILNKPATSYSGHFLLDDEVLSAAGERNFDRYRVDPSMPPSVDLFVDTAAPLPPGVTLSAQSSSTPRASAHESGVCA